MTENSEPFDYSRQLQYVMGELMEQTCAINRESLRLLSEAVRIPFSAVETDRAPVNTEPHWYPWAMIAGLFAMLIIAAKFLPS